MTTERELLQRALEGLEDRRYEIEGWGAYADDYFQTKWGLAASITAYDNVITEIRDYLATAPVDEVYAHYDADGQRTTDSDQIRSILLVRKIV